MIPDMVLYIVLSIPWGVAGFLAGFASGARACVWSTAMPTPVERPTKTPSTKPARGGDHLPWYRRSNFWIGSAVAAMGLVGATQWYLQGAETRRVADCVAVYSNGYADALDARTEANREVTEAQDGLWILINQGLASPSPEIREQFQTKLSEYISAREASKRAQTEKPYPDPPRDVCR